MAEGGRCGQREEEQEGHGVFREEGEEKEELDEVGFGRQAVELG